jgi:cold shock CspA family protein
MRHSTEHHVGGSVARVASVGRFKAKNKIPAAGMYYSSTPLDVTEPALTSSSSALLEPATGVTEEKEPSSAEPEQEAPEPEAAAAEHRSVPYDDDDETLTKTGVVKLWLPEHGHGVISPDDGTPDIFFKQTCLDSQIDPGDVVYYTEAWHKEATAVSTNFWFGCQ